MLKSGIAISCACMSICTYVYRYTACVHLVLLLSGGKNITCACQHYSYECSARQVKKLVLCAQNHNFSFQLQEKVDVSEWQVKKTMNRSYCINRIR